MVDFSQPIPLFEKMGEPIHQAELIAEMLYTKLPDKFCILW